jgi:hypothetical protein
VALNFQAVQGWGKTASDARGAYAVVLPRVDGGGFDPTTIDARFLPSVLHESDIPYATLSPSERADLAQSAAGGDMASTPVDGSPSATVVVRDLFVVRRSTDR